MFSSPLLNWIFILVVQLSPIEAESNAQKYSSYHSQAYSFCKANAMNTEFYFLLDFSIHSGKKRFFIHRFSDSTLVNSDLVTHGACDVFEENIHKYSSAKFSNRVDSHCSSAGKYKIGKRDYSSWGIGVKYWLHGLETSNSNAQKRVVVLHSWNAVDDNEIFPNYSVLSWGCPSVSDNFMRKLDQLLQTAKQPTLLWIIN
jgi:hypothetical protein